MDFVDKAFARRLEAAEGMPQVQYARLKGLAAEIAENAEKNEN